MTLERQAPLSTPAVVATLLAAASVLAFFLAVALVLVGCMSPLARAERAFRSGDYPDAKDSLAVLEPRVREWSPERAAEFALYRGLTFAALGDRERAERWLRQAAAWEQVRPGTLSAEDAHRLQTVIEASDP